ncbi:protein BIG GRAIN 1-like B [Salvia divinorum]|uniref:Protein BIG GRAIN 1-like B n=1 Tax=Salvia divinorum TaxID=28513 RepID=A0ABD1H7B0_SALDI
MYAREKLSRDQSQKSRKSGKAPPSFSSTLLDEIYLSIDGNADEINGYDSTGSSRRTCFVEKWMEKERIKQQEADTKPVHDDVVFFSSTSSSSDSSGTLSSSDTEFFGSTGRARPKPVRTGTRSEPGRFKFDDVRTGPVEAESKSRALRMYANLKKVKQPISPGGRLTSFINSLVSNASGKKSRNLESRDDDRSTARKCSSASSFSRSFLNKYSPRVKEKARDEERRTVRIEPEDLRPRGHKSAYDRDEERRTVRIEPEDFRPRGHKSVYDRNEERSPVRIEPEELRPRGHKSAYNGDSGRLGRPPLPTARLNKKVEIVAQKQNAKRGGVFHNVEEYDDEEDRFSDSSSDLFELDHLAFFGSDSRLLR